jgi:ribulose-5-phosphate 4-epimerase/fuculose-1-phosphate aldolase
MASIKPKELDRLSAAGKRMYEAGLTTGTLGAVGVRLPGGGIVLTAEGTRLGFLRKADLLVMNGSITPEERGRRPGKDTTIITAVLSAQQDAGSVIRVHSPYTTALAHKGRKALERASELFENLAGVAFVPYYRPGTAGLAGAVAEVMRSNRVAIIEGQGAVVWGRDIEDAIDQAEALEAAARVAFILSSSNGT